MLQILNENAGAIQALATIVLVAITGIYVVLTRQMAAAAGEEARAAIEQTTLLRHQLELQERQFDQQVATASELRLSEQERRGQHVRRLKVLINDLNRRLEAIPQEKGIPIDRLRLVEGWTASEAAELRDLAPILGDEAAEAGTKAASALQWIAGRFELLNNVPKGPGSATIKGMFGDQWYPKLADARAALDVLLDIAAARDDVVHAGA